MNPELLPWALMTTAVEFSSHGIAAVAGSHAVASAEED